MIKEGKTVRIQRWKALLYKDLCDLRSNGQILFNLIIGVVFVSIASFFSMQELPVSFLLAFIFVMLTMMIQGNLVVEEYEQRTIRRLQEAGFSLKDIIISKMLVTFTITVLVLIIFFFFSNNHIIFSLKLFLLILPILIIMLIAGSFLGMKTKNTIEVSLYGMPIVILYFFVEGLLMNSEKGEMPWLVVFPNYHLHYGIEQIRLQEPFFSYLSVPAVWMSLIILWFVLWFKNTKNKI